MTPFPPKGVLTSQHLSTLVFLKCLNLRGFLNLRPLFAFINLAQILSQIALCGNKNEIYSMKTSHFGLIKFALNFKFYLANSDKTELLSVILEFSFLLTINFIKIYI